MKTKNLMVMSVLSLLFAGACGVVPEAYRGDFQESSANSRLLLKKNKGILTSPQQILEAKAKTLDVENLEKGEPGIYVRENPINKALLDVFWVEPDFSTRQEAGGILWYNTAVYYTLFDASRVEPVTEIRLLYSGEGTVMVEKKTKLWQVGWPASAQEFKYQRVGKNTQIQAKVPGTLP